MNISWFSGGITSAVATKKAIEVFPDLKIIFIETGSHHPDTQRFLKDCEEWYGRPIEILQSRYKDVFDVIERTRFINGAKGARCTTDLKVRVRQQYEYDKNIEGYIWGFENAKKEIKRFQKIQNKYTEYKHYSPLIDYELTKPNCMSLLQQAGIEEPKMYKLGYHNNNCIGCVKGGMGYWNKIRVDFPHIFNRMAKLEREIGYTCIREEKKIDGKRVKMPLFLDTLHPARGRDEGPIVAECSIFCGEINIAA